MRKTLLAVCLVMLSLFTGCETPITSGTVIEHQFVSDHEEYDVIMIGDTFCLMPHCVPDRWYVRVCSTNKRRTQWIQVTKKAYDTLKDGDLYERTDQ